MHYKENRVPFGTQTKVLVKLQSFNILSPDGPQSHWLVLFTFHPCLDVTRHTPMASVVSQLSLSLSLSGLHCAVLHRLAHLLPPWATFQNAPQRTPHNNRQTIRDEARWIGGEHYLRTKFKLICIPYKRSEYDLGLSSFWKECSNSILLILVWDTLWV